MAAVTEKPSVYFLDIYGEWFDENDTLYDCYAFNYYLMLTFILKFSWFKTANKLGWIWLN